jgi:hypothetical protein
MRWGLVRIDGMCFKGQKSGFQIGNFKSAQESSSEIADRIGEFGIQLPVANLNNGLRQDISQFGGGFRRFKFLQGGTVHRSTATALAAQRGSPSGVHHTPISVPYSRSSARTSRLVLCTTFHWLYPVSLVDRIATDRVLLGSLCWTDPKQ